MWNFYEKDYQDLSFEAHGCDYDSRLINEALYNYNGSYD